MEIFFTYHIRQLFCVFCFANTIAPHEQWNRYQLATSQRTSGFAFVVMLLILIVFSIIFLVVLERVVVLWINIILSPIGVLVLDDERCYSHQYWLG